MGNDHRDLTFETRRWLLCTLLEIVSSGGDEK